MRKPASACEFEQLQKLNNSTCPVSAFIGTWTIGSECADNFYGTDLFSMGDLRLTPEGMVCDFCVAQNVKSNYGPNTR
jgi:hypothetical protein